MEIILDFFNTIQGLGATVMMPIIIFLMGLILRAGFGKSLRAGLTVGVGFYGLNLVIGALGGSLVPAINQIVENYGLELSIIDVGWPSAAAIAFASTVGMVIIPIGLVVNVVMLLTNTTQTINVDIWDYWHFAFTGALVAVLTGNSMFGIIAAVLNMIIVMVIGDYTAPGVEETLGLPGVSLPHGFTAAYAPIAVLFNKIMDKIPGVKDIDINLENIQSKFGVIGEPIMIGTFLGLAIGVIAKYEYPQVLLLAVTMGSVLVLIPKMAALLMEGLIPVSDAATEFVKQKFSGRGKIYIGLDSAVGVGHPLTLAVSLILIPLTVFMAVVLPGNQVLPFTDLSVIPWMFVLIIPVVRGNGFRALVIGIVALAVGLLISTNLAPLITEAAIQAKFTLPEGASLISSICDGANPLTWIIVRLFEFEWLGVGAVGAISIVMAIWNRNRILKEAEEIRKADLAA